MDYCSSCRRHLNGALVCPGCGAYAPDIAPATTDGRISPAPAAVVTTGSAAGPAVAWQPTASDPWHHDRLRDEAAADRNEVQQTGPSDEPEGVPPAPQGRAARRRQLARWKKNQRRAVVATAVALVGGGLTVATMERGSGDRAQAATAPDLTGMGGVEEEAPQYAPPSSAPPGTHRSSHTPAAHPSATGLPHRQSTAAPAGTTPPNARPDAATSVQTSQGQTGHTTHTTHTTTSGRQEPRTTSPSSGGTVTDDTGTPPKQPSAPTTGTGTDPGTTQPSPAPAATSPSEICLLVVCLG
ncbi:hypothetical protein ACFOZ0_09995 [Streptomyces yaanensis]|uniref:Uncharacterized protein n=1 Tax=Streptomyces yaanensis TaxID=1142239 RepID=A0ABV7SDZ7_9ACTN|nr:hypothetical protein [Streptomyces sp. CGMCC 4.7035]WNB96684.1 hypothetical protein Q2K21_00585 [Streptomyces sp. CGMCC 4.7035]